MANSELASVAKLRSKFYTLHRVCHLHSPQVDSFTALAHHCSFFGLEEILNASLYFPFYDVSEII